MELFLVKRLHGRIGLVSKMFTFIQFISENLEAYRENHPKLKAAKERLDTARKAVGGGNRWGETRRFSGARAGNRLNAVDKALKSWGRTYDAVTKEYHKNHLNGI